MARMNKVLSQTASQDVCRCGDPEDFHQHYRAGSECSSPSCGCPRLRLRQSFFKSLVQPTRSLNPRGFVRQAEDFPSKSGLVSHLSDPRAAGGRRSVPESNRLRLVWSDGRAVN